MLAMSSAVVVAVVRRAAGRVVITYLLVVLEAVEALVRRVLALYSELVVLVVREAQVAMRPQGLLQRP